MWSVSLLFSILVICAMQKCRGCDATDGLGTAFGGILSVLALFIFNLVGNSSIVDWLIQGCMVVISLKIWLNHAKNYDVTLSTEILGITIVAAAIMTVVMLVTGEFDHNLSTTEGVEVAQKSDQVESEKRGKHWDYENPEIITVEYSIMGISGKDLMINISWNGENSLRLIPLDSIKMEFNNSVLTPYVYRKNYIYTEYNYSKNPPEVLRQDTETWSDYVLCGSREQIQKLFGYSESFDFEQ